MKPLVLPLPGTEPLAARLAIELGAEFDLHGIVPMGPDARMLHLRRPATRRDVVFVSSLAGVDESFLPLLLLARGARADAASSVLLVAPCLPEPAVARPFVAILARQFDTVLTVRGGDEQDGTEPPWLPVPAWPAVASALSGRAASTFLVAVSDGQPWMEEIARGLGLPLLGPAALLNPPADIAGRLPARQPVLLTERVGTGAAIAQAAANARASGWPAPPAIAIHAEPGVVIEGVDLWTTNTRLDASNRIDVSAGIAAAIHRLWCVAAASRFGRHDGLAVPVPAGGRQPVAAAPAR